MRLFSCSIAWSTALLTFDISTAGLVQQREKEKSNPAHLCTGLLCHTRDLTQRTPCRRAAAAFQCRPENGENRAPSEGERCWHHTMYGTRSGNLRRGRGVLFGQLKALTKTRTLLIGRDLKR
jgi:hypothetical protein